MIAECPDCSWILGEGYDFGDVIECPRCHCLYVVGGENCDDLDV